MPEQAPSIDVKPGDKGRLVYDKARRTIVAERPASNISDRLRDRAAKASEPDKSQLYDAADAIDSLRSALLGIAEELRTAATGDEHEMPSAMNRAAYSLQAISLGAFAPLQSPKG